MTAISDKSIANLLQKPSDQSVLAFIQKKIQELKQLNRLWQKEATDGLATHSCVANFRNNILVIEVNSASWATRLRFSLPELLARLSKHTYLQSLKTIEWYIEPEQRSAPVKLIKKPLLTLSQENKLLIQSTAESLTNPSTAAALIRIIL